MDEKQLFVIPKLNFFVSTEIWTRDLSNESLVTAPPFTAATPLLFKPKVQLTQVACTRDDI